MSDLISRNVALEAMDTWDKFGRDQNGMLVRYDDNKHYVPYVRYDDMVYVIKSLPSVEKKGKWIKENRVLTSNPPQYVWHCSECGTSVYGFSSGILTPYCHKCGAKMEVYE